MAKIRTGVCPCCRGAGEVMRQYPHRCTYCQARCSSLGACGQPWNGVTNWVEMVRPANA